MERTERILPSTSRRLAASDYRFVPHDRNWLVNKYKYGMQVENLEYTTILQVTVEDQIPRRPSSSWTASRPSTSTTRCRAGSTSTEHAQLH